MILSESDEKDIRHIFNVEFYRLAWFSKMRDDYGWELIRIFTSLSVAGYLNPCPHFHSGCDGFYTQLRGDLQDASALKPCAQFDDLNEVLSTLPDPPPGCAPEHRDEAGKEMDCPLQPSFIRNVLRLVAEHLRRVNDASLEDAFRKEL